MTPLRRRMLDALVVCGKAARTQEASIDAVARLAGHFRPPVHSPPADTETPTE